MGDSLSLMNFACCGNRNPQEPTSSVVSFGGINDILQQATNFKTWEDQTISTIIKYYYETIEILFKILYHKSIITILLVSIHKVATARALLGTSLVKDPAQTQITWFFNSYMVENL